MITYDEIRQKYKYSLLDNKDHDLLLDEMKMWPDQCFIDINNKGDQK